MSGMFGRARTCELCNPLSPLGRTSLRKPDLCHQEKNGVEYSYWGPLNDVMRH